MIQAHAFGGPPLRGVMRASAEDFVVTEELGFVPSGEGEHVLLQIEKRGANTDWVADGLARFAGVDRRAVSFSGLKDRHAVTRQTFSIQLPGRQTPDWDALELEGVRVLSSARHNRKLRRGAHRSNHFVIRLRALQGDRAQAQARLQQIASLGVPNYFGEQRFGRQGSNLDLAGQLFGGRRLQRSQRGFALSAARAWLFNGVLAQRVAQGSWNQPLPGEVWMLDGTHSLFGPDPLDESLRERVAAGDIHPTGPLWGEGELRSGDEVRELELQVAAEHAELCHGLERFELQQERRALRLPVADFAFEWQGDDALELRFRLPAGAFATAVLRELCDWREPAPAGAQAQSR